MSGRILYLASLAEGDLPGAGSNGVKTGTHGPTTGFEHLRRVIETIGDSGNEEVGEVGRSFDGVAPGEVEHSLLSGRIREGGCREFAGGRVEQS